jgi:uncharacterized membrane protein YcaP (DUF421 family)
MLVSAIRTCLLYLLLVLGMRLMGKRQVGQMQPSELVTTFLLSELITAPILDSDIPLLGAVIPFLLVICAEIIVPWLASRYPAAKRIVDGRPSMVIFNGEIDQKELLRLRMSVDELLGHLRLKGVGDIQDVQYAFVEQNGQLSVILRAGAAPASVDDLKISPVRRGMAHPLVVQGQVSDFHLSQLGYDRIWLTRKLDERNCGVDEVLLFSLDDNGNYNLIIKEKT